MESQRERVGQSLGIIDGGSLKSLAWAGVLPSSKGGFSRRSLESGRDGRAIESQQLSDDAEICVWPAKHRRDQRERREIVPQRGARLEVDGGDGCG